MIFVGHDWAEDHHDVVVLDDNGRKLATARLDEGVGGLTRLATLVAEAGADLAEVVVGTETDRGLFIGALVAAGAEVYAVNPKVVDRYRDRLSPSGSKNDRLDALVLAELVRTDRHLHRRIASDSPAAEGLKVMARAHKDLVWRQQQFVAQLRSALRDYYPAALAAFDDLTHSDALSVLAVAATPAAGRALSPRRIEVLLRRGGRQRNVSERARAIAEALRGEVLEAPAVLVDAYAGVIGSLVEIVVVINRQLAQAEAKLTTAFDAHALAPLYASLPGLGPVLAARALGEFGDDPDRYASARNRRNYAGTAPVTRQSGKTAVVTRRVARNQRLADTCIRWAFCSLSGSPGARRYYDAMRARGKGHHAALHQLANRWVGILHGCLATGNPYDENLAWPDTRETASMRIAS